MAAKKGICAICGKGGKLTKEHIPPQCAGNEKDVELHTLKDWLSVQGDVEKLPNPILQPEGTYYATLCKRCNEEVLGAWYVPNFCRFVRGTARAIAQQVVSGGVEDLKNMERPWLRVWTQPTVIRPLCLVKVIAGMVLALNAESDPSFQRKHADLAGFVLDKDAFLPAPYRAYLAVHLGPCAAFAPYMMKKEPNKPPVAFSGVDYPPLAYLLTFNEAAPDTDPFLSLGGLANFASCSYETKGTIEIDLLVGFRRFPIPGSYGPDRVA